MKVDVFNPKAANSRPLIVGDLVQVRDPACYGVCGEILRVDGDSAYIYSGGILGGGSYPLSSLRLLEFELAEVESVPSEDYHQKSG